MTAVVRRETREKGNEDMKRKDKIPCVFKKKKKKIKRKYSLLLFFTYPAPKDGILYRN